MYKLPAHTSYRRDEYLDEVQRTQERKRGIYIRWELCRTSVPLERDIRRYIAEQLVKELTRYLLYETC